MKTSALTEIGLQPVTIAIIEKSNDFVGIADSSGTALFVNQAGRQIFGLPSDVDLATLTMLDFIAKRDQELFMSEVVARASATDRVEKAVHVRDFTTGEVFMMDFSFFVMPLPEDSGHFFMTFGKDLRATQAVQHLLNDIQQSLNIGGWQIDTATGRNVWSEQVYQIYKLPVGTVLEKETAIDFYAPHERERLARIVNACSEEGQPFDDEFEFFDAEGEHRWVRATGNPVYNEQGEIYQLRGTIQDITDRKTMELKGEEASLELEIFRQLVQNSNDFIGITDKHWTPIYLNPAGRQLIGVSEQQSIRDMPVSECYPERLRASVFKHIQAALEAGDVVTTETFFQHIETREEIPVLGTHFVIRDTPTGEHMGYATITRDMTQVSELRRAIERERVQSIQSSKLASLGELAAGVAHEINNPLAIISGSMELVGHHVDNPVEIPRYVEKVQRSVARISSIVQSLRKYAHQSTGLHLQTVDLMSMIQESVTLVQSKATRSRHRIEVGPRDAPAPCYCDELQIGQILINLLLNSVDANLDREDSWSLVTLSNIEDGYQIRVQDSGSGIDQSIVETMFDPFFTTKEVGRGTGLGLSISSGIAADHGGRLAYELYEEHTSFILTLPQVAQPPGQ